MLVVCLSAVYAVALALLLWVARRNKGMYAAAKGLCSLWFVLCCAAAFFAGAHRDVLQFTLLLSALVLCAFGDVFLGVANQAAGKVGRRPFLLGAASFSAAHVVFCVLFAIRSPLKWYDVALPAALLLVLRLLEHMGLVRLKKMRPLGYLYTFLVGFMAGKAAESVYSAGLYNLHGLCVAAGALLFLLSDVVLLFLYFGTRRRGHLRVVNLLSYYLGVYLLAWSAYWF